uniref:Uncharacterized protein LOC111118103 n=1 Tax=Crassostrea virginica TaxID=6565 RepID=A0A8B8CBI3_CRAVI|nr:uncharacterized protein LOC111118103 [Crassostrea virginica]
MKFNLILIFLCIGKVHSWWELVYKVVTGAPFGAHALFINNGTRNTNNLAAQQLTNQVLDHYKSDVMDDMHTNGVTKIRVSYYLGGVEAKYFVFDAVGATNTDWFSRSRLLETNYDITALTTAVGKFGEYFSIAGDTVTGGVIKRHFYINEGYYGCAGDKGWVLVVDGPGPCLMDQVSTTTVYFVNTASFSLTPGVTADFMAVFVERGICSGTSPAPSSTTVPSNGYLMINETEKLEKKITEIKTNLTVPVNTTSQYLRSKSCANDERISSRAMGMVLGAGLLSALAAFILFPDLQTVCSHILKGICNLCRKRKQQNQLLK